MNLSVKCSCFIREGRVLFIKGKIFSPSTVGQNTPIECNDLSAFLFIVILPEEGVFFS
jgi:hypothetical protein